jgi:DNA-binding XRE family transcriptional regulator
MWERAPAGSRISNREAAGAEEFSVMELHLRAHLVQGIAGPYDRGRADPVFFTLRARGAFMAGESNSRLERLGARIKRLRQERGLSQDRLAIGAHIDQSGLSKFERGKDSSIGDAAVRRIAAQLNIGFEELVAGTEFGDT